MTRGLKVDMFVHLQEGHRPFFPRQPVVVELWVCSLGGHAATEHGMQLVSPHPASLTFCLSLLPQHGVRYSPTCRPLSRDSGPSGHIKLKRGSRNCSTHTRICIQVCKLLEMVLKDGIGSLSCP